MKLIRIYLLRAITPTGESTSLGSLGIFPSESQALESVMNGKVKIPNGCYAQAVPAYAVAEEAPEAAMEPAPKKATATKPADTAGGEEKKQ